MNAPRRVGCEILLAQEHEDLGIWRAILLCVAFDVLLALLITGVWRCVH